MPATCSAQLVCLRRRRGRSPPAPVDHPALRRPPRAALQRPRARVPLAAAGRAAAREDGDADRADRGRVRQAADVLSGWTLRHRPAPRAAALPTTGYVVDSSVTPLWSWRSLPRDGGQGGPDFREQTPRPFTVRGSGPRGLLEIPVTLFATYAPLRRWPLLLEGYRSLPVRAVRKLFLSRWLSPQPLWLTPDPRYDDADLQAVWRCAASAGLKATVMMFHSSELMPGGSPFRPDAQSVRDLLGCLDRFFAHVRACGEEFATLGGLATEVLAGPPTGGAVLCEGPHPRGLPRQRRARASDGACWPHACRRRGAATSGRWTAARSRATCAPAACRSACTREHRASIPCPPSPSPATSRAGGRTSCTRGAGCRRWLPVRPAGYCGIPHVDGMIQSGALEPDFTALKRLGMAMATLVVANTQAGLRRLGRPAGEGARRLQRLRRLAPSVADRGLGAATGRSPSS